MTKLLVDNSAISIIGQCQRKYQLAVIKGLHAPKDKTALFGDIYHRALERLDKDEEPAKVVNELFDFAPNIDKIKMLKTLIKFKLGHKKLKPLIINGAPAIEHKFSFLYKFTAPYEIYLQGTIDLIEHDNNFLRVIDYKTSVGATKYQVRKTTREYELAFQLPFYVFALYHGILPADLKELITSSQYSTEIWCAFYNMDEPFHRIIRGAFNKEFFNAIIPAIIDSRINQMIEVAELTKQDIPAPYSGMNVYNACANCQFRAACQVAGSAREVELLSHYPVRPYEPLNFR